MALTAGRWFTVYTLAETSGRVTTVKYEQSAPADDTAARASAAAMATDLGAVTNCTIKSYYTYQLFEEDAFALPASAEIENEALLQVTIEDEATKTGTLRIPSPVDGIFSGATGPSYDVVDTTDTDLIAFVANFITEDLFYVSDGEQAETLVGGHRRHRKSARS